MVTTIGQSALARVDLIVAQGADNSYRFRFSTGDPLTPVDLTGWTARMQLRDRKGGALWVTVTDGAGVELGADGYIDVALPHTATEGTAWNDYRRGVFDLELTDPAGVRVRFVEGNVTVSNDVTRD